MKNHIISSTIGKIKYFFSQSITNVKKNFLIGITFAICFSLVAGLSFTGESAKVTILNAALDETSNVEGITVDYNEQIGAPFYEEPNFDNLLITEIESRDIPYYDTYFLSTNYYLYNHYFRQNDTSILNNSQYLAGLSSFSTNFHYLISNERLYQSESFTDQVRLFEGNYPTKDNEILVDILFADAFNLQVGDITNFSYFVKEGFNTDELNEFSTDIMWTISGISVTTGTFRLLRDYFDNDAYEYNENVDNITLDQSIQNMKSGESGIDSLILDLPIYGYFNFSNENQPFLHPYTILTEDHPAFRMNDNNGLDIYQQFYENINYGLGIFLDTSRIRIGNIERDVLDFQTDMAELEYVFDDKISVRSDVISILDDFTYTFQLIQLILFILNIPVILFAIILGSLAIKNETKNRLEEYLLLRSKGMKTRTIRTQLIFESISLSLMSSLIGFVIGIPIFYGIRGFADETLQAFDVPSLIFVFNLTPLWLTVVTGVITSLIASLGSIILIKKLPAHQLLKIMGQSSLDAEFSEMSIFGDPGFTEVHKDTKADLISKAKFMTREEIKLLPKDDQKRIKERQKLDRIYKRTIDKKSSSTPFGKRLNVKVASFYIILGLIPIILVILGIWSQYPSAPDFIFKMFHASVSGSVSLSDYLPYTLILTPFFLTSGIIRVIGLENPQILARFTAKVTKPVLGKMGRLVGLESIRKKQYSKVAIIVGVFIALLIFSSTLLFSMLNMPVLDYQADAGADIRVTMYNPWFESTGTDVTSIDNLTTIENELKAIKAFENPNISIIDDVTTILTTSVGEFGSQGNEAQELMMFSNISKLYDILSEDNKFLPDKNIKKLDGIAAENSDGKPYSILTNYAADFYNVSVGDTLELNHKVYFEEDYVYHPISNQLLDRPPRIYGVQTEVAAIIDVLPGIWFNGYSPLFPYNYVYDDHEQLFSLIDISVLNNDESSDDYCPYNTTLFSYSHLIDIADDVYMDNNNTNHLSAGIRSVTRAWYNTVFDSVFYMDSYEEMLTYEDEPNAVSTINNAFILEFGIIGLVLAIGIAVLIISFQQSNKFFNGVLLARGYGKSGLFKFVFSLIAIIYSIAYVIGASVGVLTTFFSMRAFSMWDTFIAYGSIPLPLVINWSMIILIIGLVPLATIALYLINYVFESRKSVSKYFHKF